MPGGDRDSRIRLAAFEFHATQTRLAGDGLPRELLAAGLVFEGQRCRRF